MQILKDEVRDNILIQAEQLFFENGYVNTSTRMIAEKTGMHYTSMYRYFKSKSALFDAIVGDYYRKFITGFTNFMDEADDNSPLEERISELGQGLFSAIKDDRKKFVILIRRSKGTKYASVFEEMVGLLKQHMSEDIFNEEKQKQVVQVVSYNFLKGVGDIAETCVKPDDLKISISAFVRYHLSGIASFQ